MWPYYLRSTQYTGSSLSNRKGRDTTGLQCVSPGQFLSGQIHARCGADPFISDFSCLPRSLVRSVNEDERRYRRSATIAIRSPPSA